VFFQFPMISTPFFFASSTVIPSTIPRKGRGYPSALGKLNARAVGPVGVHRGDDDVLASRNLQRGGKGEFLVSPADPFSLPTVTTSSPLEKRAQGGSKGMPLPSTVLATEAR